MGGRGEGGGEKGRRERRGRRGERWEGRGVREEPGTNGTKAI